MRAFLLILTGVIYLALVLFNGLESPLFSLAFIAVAGYEIVRLHRTQRPPQESGRRSVALHREAAGR
jgi:hypothetical protein